MLPAPLQTTPTVNFHKGNRRDDKAYMEKYLAGFRKINLESMETIALMKRYDTKFLFHVDHLPAIIDLLFPAYAVLEIDEKRVFKYQNQYYDTADYFFYHQHHNQNLSRHKFRCRHYVDTQQCYFEVKSKTNRKKTIKSRLLLDHREISPELPAEAKAFARQCLWNGNRSRVDEIKPALLVGYHRMTLASFHNKERITFDINLTFSDQETVLNVDSLAIAELKTVQLLLKSDFFQSLKAMHILPATFSKYCMGIVLMGKNVKYNRFKHDVTHLGKITSCHFSRINNTQNV